MNAKYKKGDVVLVAQSTDIYEITHTISTNTDQVSVISYVLTHANLERDFIAEECNVVGVDEMNNSINQLAIL